MRPPNTVLGCNGYNIPLFAIAIATAQSPYNSSCNTFFNLSVSFILFRITYQQIYRQPRFQIKLFLSFQIKSLVDLDYLFRSSYISSRPFRFSLWTAVKEAADPSASMRQSAFPFQPLRKRKLRVRNSSNSKFSVFYFP